MLCINMNKKNNSLIILFVLLNLICINLSSAASYGSGPYGSGAYGIGYTASSGITGGASSGGGTACDYEWVCSEWYPEPCPSDGIQKRVCVNRGTCSGTSGMPSLNQTCIPVIISPAEPLFDIFVNVPFQYKWILKGDNVAFNVKLINVGNKTTIDVSFQYLVTDKNNKLITEKKETRAIGEKEEFNVELILPEDLSEDIYKIYVQINYGANQTAAAGDSFEVVKSELIILLKSIISFPYILITLTLLVAIILMIIFIIHKLFRNKINKKPEINFKKLIYSAEKSKKEFSDYLTRINEDYSKGKISSSAYTKILSQKKNGKTIQEWIKYFERYEEECKKRLKKKR